MCANRLALAFIFLVAQAVAQQSSTSQIDTFLQRIAKQEQELAELKAQVTSLLPAVRRPTTAVAERDAQLNNETVVQTQTTSVSEPQPVVSGFGTVKFDGLIQGWYAAGNQGFRDTFRLRRGELRFTGDLLTTPSAAAVDDNGRFSKGP